MSKVQFAADLGNQLMLRFSIRDLLWLTIVVALAVGWWRSDKMAKAAHQIQLAEAHNGHHLAVNQTLRMRGELTAAKKRCGELERDYSWAMDKLSDQRVNYMRATRTTVDWSILNEPVVTPNPRALR